VGYWRPFAANGCPGDFAPLDRRPAGYRWCLNLVAVVSALCADFEPQARLHIIFRRYPGLSPEAVLIYSGSWPVLIAQLWNRDEQFK
jgi:hypothetical protein